MKITTFIAKITEKEGKKVSVNNAQVGEVIKLTNQATGGALYKKVKEIPEDSQLF